MSEHEGPRVEQEKRVAAGAGRVWEAWTDPALIAGWFVERAVGRAEEGGRVIWAWDRFGLEVEQEVLVADERRRLVLRSPQPGGVGASVLEVVLEPEDGGVATVVRVVESGFGGGPEGEARREGAETGWALALGVLDYYLKWWFGRASSEALALRPVPTPCGSVAPLYDDEAESSRWLALDGRAAPGPVLARAGAERLLAWEEIGGTLELKAFPSPDGGSTVGVRATSWTLTQGEMDALGTELEAAVDRLVGRLG